MIETPGAGVTAPAGSGGSCTSTCLHMLCAALILLKTSSSASEPGQFDPAQILFLGFLR
jgi:hypothetical protein